MSVDIDTCLENDVCDQLCVHVNGSLTCRCHGDYEMNPATRDCRAKGENQMTINPGGNTKVCSYFTMKMNSGGTRRFLDEGLV